MKTYTYSEARQRLASLLEEAARAGCVQIRRRDGQLFVLQPAREGHSPLDVPGVNVGLASGEAAEWLALEREASGNRVLQRAATRVRRTGKRGGSAAATKKAGTR